MRTEKCCKSLWQTRGNFTAEDGLSKVDVRFDRDTVRISHDDNFDDFSAVIMLQTGELMQLGHKYCRLAVWRMVCYGKTG